jgi:hypothetical protein
MLAAMPSSATRPCGCPRWQDNEKVTGLCWPKILIPRDSDQTGHTIAPDGANTEHQISEALVWASPHHSWTGNLK